MPYTLEDRMEHLAFAYSSPTNLQAFIARCEVDYKFFIAMATDTFNPRLKYNKSGPFLPYFRQEECLDFIHYAIENDQDTVIEKTRNTGISWLEMAYRLWRWLFKEQYQCIVGSRVDKYIDSPGLPDCLFWKFDYLYNSLPDFLKVPGYTGTLPYRVSMKIENPVNGSVIRGEAVTQDWAAGGRSVDVLMDEMSKCTYAKAAWDTAAQTASSRHGVATPNGQEFFYQLVHPDEAMLITGNRYVPRPLVFRIHWKDDDRFNFFEIQNSRKEVIATGNGYSPFDVIPVNRGYDDGKGYILHREVRQPIEKLPTGAMRVVYPWYEKERARYDDVAAARELDIDYEGSTANRVYAVQLALSKKTRCPRNPSYPLYVWCDPGHNDSFALVWAQWSWARRGYEIIDEYMNNGRSAYFYVPFLTGREEHIPLAEEEGATDKDIEFIRSHSGPDWRIDALFIDPSGNNKTANSKESVVSIFQSVDGKDEITGNIVGLIPTSFSEESRLFPNRIRSLQRVLKRAAFDVEKCPRTLTAISMIVRPKKSETSQATKEVEGWVHHSVYSHPVAACEYGACNDPHFHDTPDWLIHDEDEDEDGNKVNLNGRYPKTIEEILGYNPDETKPRSRAGYG